MSLGQSDRRAVRVGRIKGRMIYLSVKAIISISSNHALCDNGPLNIEQRKKGNTMEMTQ